MKSLKKNYIYNVLYQMLIMLLPFVTAPYVSRVFGANGVGVFSYKYSIANYFLLFGMLGISNYGNRGVAGKRDNTSELNIFFSEVYSLQFLTMSAAIIVYTIYLIVSHAEYMQVSICMYIYLISGLLDISWLFFGLEEFKITVIRNAIIKIATVLLIFLFVKESTDIVIYSIIMCSGVLVSQLYLWLYVFSKVHYSFPSIKNVFKHLKSIVILFIPVLSYSIYKIMDKVMLGSMTDYYQSGIYANAEKAVSIPIGVITAFGTVMLPRMTNLIANKKMDESRRYISISFNVITMISSAIAFGLIGVSDIFSPVFFGQGYDGCETVIKILSISVLFSSWGSIVRNQYLVPNHKDKPYVISTIIGAVVNLVTNIILIPRLGAAGAAIGTLVAELLLMSSQMFFVRNEENFIKNIYKNIAYVIFGIVMSMVVNSYGSYHSHSVLTLALQVLFGGTIFLLLSFGYIFYKKDYVYEMLSSMLKRFYKTKV